MRIAVTGGRSFGDLSKEKTEEKKKEYKYVHFVLNNLCEIYSKEKVENDNWLPVDIVIISGGAKGVDSAAADFATVHYTQYEEFKADWKNFGKAAGILRNIRMSKEGHPDILIAFPGGNGTAHMVRQCRKEGIPVLIATDLYPFEDFNGKD